MFSILDTVKSYAIYALILVGVFSGGIGVGYRYEHSALLALQEKQAQAAAKETIRVVTSDEKHLEAEQQGKVIVQKVIQTVTQNVEHIVEKPIYRNVCLDNDGVLSANAALSNTSPSTTGVAPQMPATDAAN